MGPISNKQIFICQQHFKTDQYHVYETYKTLISVEIPELNLPAKVYSSLNQNQNYQLIVPQLNNKSIHYYRHQVLDLYILEAVKS